MSHRESTCTGHCVKQDWAHLLTSPALAVTRERGLWETELPQAHWQKRTGSLYLSRNKATMPQECECKAFCPHLHNLAVGWGNFQRLRASWITVEMARVRRYWIMSIDLGVTNKFERVGQLINTEFVNNDCTHFSNTSCWTCRATFIILLGFNAHTFSKFPYSHCLFNCVVIKN